MALSKEESQWFDDFKRRLAARKQASIIPRAADRVYGLKGNSDKSVSIDEMSEDDVREAYELAKEGKLYVSAINTPEAKSAVYVKNNGTVGITVPVSNKQIKKGVSVADLPDEPEQDVPQNENTQTEQNKKDDREIKQPAAGRDFVLTGGESSEKQRAANGIGAPYSKFERRISDIESSKALSDARKQIEKNILQEQFELSRLSANPDNPNLERDVTKAATKLMAAVVIKQLVTGKNLPEKTLAKFSSQQALEKFANALSKTEVFANSMRSMSKNPADIADMGTAEIYKLMAKEQDKINQRNMHKSSAQRVNAKTARTPAAPSKSKPQVLTNSNALSQSTPVLSSNPR